MESRWEGILALIFFGFWWIFGAKLAPSWVGKSIQNRTKKALKNRWQKSAVLDPSWVPKGAQHGPAASAADPLTRGSGPSPFTSGRGKFRRTEGSKDAT